MLGRNDTPLELFQMVDMAALVPARHFLRKVDRVLDLSFVREAVAPCYSASRGRPSIDPELVLRMLLLGTLYDLSDRELCEEIGMHVGMRWFCGLNLHDPVPDHSTLSKLKDLWSEAGVFQMVFDRVVRQCSEAGLVSGRHVSIDGSEVRANASMKSLAAREPDRKPDISPAAEAEPEAASLPEPDIRPAADSVPEPELAPAGEESPVPETPPGGDAAEGGAAKEPQPAGGWSGHGVKYGNETHRSTSDPEARLYRKGKGKEARLCYLMHDVIDTKSRVILRRRVSFAHSAEERKAALAMLDEVRANAGELGLPKLPEVASLDAGYGTGEFAAEMLERGILPHMPLQAGAEREEAPTWKRRTFDVGQQRRRKQKARVVEARNRVREAQRTRGYMVSRKLRTRSEHTFAEAKSQHGMGRARSRGCRRVQVQSDLVGIVQNLKRLAAFQNRRRGRAARACAPTRAIRRPYTLPSRSRRAWRRPIRAM
jgi:transposase